MILNLKYEIGNTVYRTAFGVKDKIEEDKTLCRICGGSGRFHEYECPNCKGIGHFVRQRIIKYAEHFTYVKEEIISFIKIYEKEYKYGFIYSEMNYDNSRSGELRVWEEEIYEQDLFPTYEECEKYIQETENI